MRATNAVIHLNNFKSNISIIKNIIPDGVKICLAVKANAYGHGAFEIAQVALKEGIDYLGVATIEEGVDLRERGIKAPVFLFSLPFPEEVESIVDADITPMIANEEMISFFAEEAAKKNTQFSVHLKVDTGMGRIGCSCEEAVGLVKLIESIPSLKLGGICTHFSGADLKNREYTQYQLKRFKKIVEEVQALGIDPGLLHAANSGALIGNGETFFNMVRPGIMAYGYYPSSEQERRYALKPVMEFKTRISFLKRVSEGTSISYGMTYKTCTNTVIATLPVGYGDGYSRLLSNRGEVLIQGKRYPIVGRVCMDQCMIDLGPVCPVKLYDEVTLFGPDPSGPDAEEIALWMGTIPYEVTCLVGGRVPRVYK